MEDGAITFATADGERTYPLTAFSKTEQRKLLIAVGQPRLPPKLLRRIAHANETLKRLNILVQNGKITPEEAQHRLENLRLSLQKFIDTLDLLPEERAYALRSLPNTRF